MYDIHEHSATFPPFPLYSTVHSIAMEWHAHSIRLAGRIWGQVQRTAADGAGF